MEERVGAQTVSPETNIPTPTARPHPRGPWLAASLAFMWGSEEEEEATDWAAVAPKNDAVEEGIAAGAVCEDRHI